jgi:hypothetical protein
MRPSSEAAVWPSLVARADDIDASVLRFNIGQDHCPFVSRGTVADEAFDIR